MMFRTLLSPTRAQRLNCLWQTLQHQNGVMSATRSQQYSNSSQEVDVDLDTKTGIAVVKWNRRPVNSLQYEFIQKSIETIRSLEENPDCKALVLTSVIPNIFCAGLDFKEIINPTWQRAKDYIIAMNMLWATIYGLKIPTIAAINGSAPAGGCVIALAFDYRIMTAGKSTIGLSELKLGITLRSWMIEVFKDVVGHRQAELAIMRGQLFVPQEALAIGLVDDLASSDEELLEKAKQQAAVFAAVPDAARQKTKMAFRQPLLDELQKNAEEYANTYADSVTSKVMQSQLTAYLDKLKKAP